MREGRNLECQLQIIHIYVRAFFIISLHDSPISFYTCDACDARLCGVSVCVCVCVCLRGVRVCFCMFEFVDVSCASIKSLYSQAAAQS